MMAQAPYVVLITSPSAGVGSTTLASNLAVYLKALVEDLPVAFASLQPTADVDARFRLSVRPQHALLELVSRPFDELFCVGQFGVDYCAAAGSEALASTEALRKGLAQADYPGVLILDVAVGSPHLAAALAAADLVLVPVKDPAALMPIVRLQKELLATGGEPQLLWLLPSQLGAAGCLQQAVERDAFLRFAAEERGFQVLDEHFCADAQVAEFSSSGSGSILTRAPQSELHQQLKQIALLLLKQRQEQNSFSVRIRRMLADGLLPARAKRILLRCPLCGAPALSGAVHYGESFPARRRLLLHRQCVESLLKGTAAAAFLEGCGLTLVQPEAPFGGSAQQLRLQVLSVGGELLGTESLTAAERPEWQDLLLAATGRCLAESYHENFIYSGAAPVAEVLTSAWYEDFLAQRFFLRQACRAEQL